MIRSDPHGSATASVHPRQTWRRSADGVTCGSPSRPSCTIAAQVAASRPPEREPSMPGEQYLPPAPVGQVEVLAVAQVALSLKQSTLEPFKA
jgi:hypothetical protein